LCALESFLCLLALSDREQASIYCILDASLPMKDYVATVQPKRVTDGERTFWHWESTFAVQRGRERVLGPACLPGNADLV
jgi:NADPH:quinone reductase